MSVGSASIIGTSDSSQDGMDLRILQTPDTSPIVSVAGTTLSAPGSGIFTSSPTGSLSVVPSSIATKVDSLQKRRSSSRSIKRKKFDDELVESSLIKTSRNRPSAGQAMPMAAGGLGPLAFLGQPTPNLIYPGAVDIGLPTTLHEKKKSSKSTSKRMKKTKNTQSVVTKDLGRWKPTDDLALVLAVQQTNDLEAVYRGVKFSCKFTLQEMQERWYALLYDQVISRVAVNAMKQLHPDVIAQVQARALFSQDEEKLLAAAVPAASHPTVETFQELLNQNPDVFLPLRTAKALLTHWTLMKQYHLLPDQSVQPLPRGEHVLNFSDAEDMMDSSELQEPRDEALEHELALADRRSKQEIRQLENELPKWQVLVDSVIGVSPPDFDHQTLAVLRGRLVRYLMRSKEITLGRSTKDNNIDVDLSLEGPPWKISRKQGIIRLRNSGDFLLINEGKRPFYVDGTPVLTGSKCKLNNNSAVEIAGLRFVFLVNQDLINTIRTEVAKSVA